MKNIQRARRAAKSSARPLMASIFLLPPLPTHTHANEHALSIRGNNDKEESYSAGLISFQAHSHISPLPTWRIECTHLHLHERVHSLTFAAKKGGGDETRTEKDGQKVRFFVWFFRPSDAALDGNATGRGKKREKATDVKRGREGWYRWERKSTSSHTETINKLSPQSISYGLAWIIALCQSCLCVAWE